MKDFSRRPHSIGADPADIPADPRVTATLRAVVGEPPYHTVDWEALRASIVGDAAALFTRRVRRPWTAYVARWSATAVPVGIAASIAAGLFMFYASSTATSSAANGAQLADAEVSPSALLSTMSGMSGGTALSATVAASFDEESRIATLLGETSQ